MNRGFEIAKGFENWEIQLPKRQTKWSAGYDIEAAETVEIKPGEVRLIKTGLKAYMLGDEVLKIYIRSSMATKKGLMLANSVGVIDSDYYGNETNDGHILIPLYNIGSDSTIINKGNKIAQGIFEKFLLIDDEEPITNHRVGGFGSSNKSE